MSDEQAEPLAPRANPDLDGHRQAEQRLLEAWASGRLPHGWLITGPRGVGKATLAYRFARFVLAHGMPGGGDAGGGLFGEDIAPAVPATLALDPDHPVFRRVASGGHADLHVIQRGLSDDGKRMQTVIPVDAVRAAGHAMSLTASEGGWRIVIVDGAEDMNPNAANAILKLLEEPPRQALLLVVSHAPGRLLPTIRSRCCQLRLGPLPRATVAALIARYRPEVGEADRELLAGLSDGSIGRALVIADSDGIGIQHDLIALLGALPGLDIVAAQKFAERVARRDSDAAWQTASALVTRAAAGVVFAGARPDDAGRVSYSAAETACFGRLGQLGGLDRWAEVWEKTGRLFAQSDRSNLDRRQVMLGALDMFDAVARAGA